MTNFVLIGAAGFVAPRHMQAIKDVGGSLIAAVDPHDSVGVLDSYFPDCQFFTEFERFDRHIDLLQRYGSIETLIDYVVVTSPNYLHDSHIKWALRIGADCICEKPVVCNIRNLARLKDEELASEQCVYTILQLRLHEAAVQAKIRLNGDNHQVNVNYVTPRGAWYGHSWKSDVAKSGGLATNIGVHLFDLMTWFFGRYEHVSVDYQDDQRVSGTLMLERAIVNWRLSISMNEEPTRMFEIDGNKLELSGGFNELHTKAYRNILADQGFGIEDARESIRICEAIRKK